MSGWTFTLWMLPWLGIALAILYAGYVAYQAREAREEAALAPPPGPDPADELERINTELARIATANRKTLEAARDAMRAGLKG
ncbi:MAG TPA: hypothetical protein VM370_02730 [Candidatus Thermoplasmatota archaeon]|nr:hypothetical protein [Candidatus Thermoplasmatota archaeon]